MLPEKILNIYPKSDENLDALIKYYFNDNDLDLRNGVQLFQEKGSLTLNQCEFIIKKLSEAYSTIFKKHLKGQITLNNLIHYGIDALENEIQDQSGSKNRQMITKEFRDFVIKKN